MYCLNCGGDLGLHDRFCTRCGTKVLFMAENSSDEVDVEDIDIRDEPTTKLEVTFVFVMHLVWTTTDRILAQWPEYDRYNEKHKKRIRWQVEIFQMAYILHKIMRFSVELCYEDQHYDLVKQVHEYLTVRVAEEFINEYPIDNLDTVDSEYLFDEVLISLTSIQSAFESSKEYVEGPDENGFFPDSDDLEYELSEMIADATDVEATPEFNLMIVDTNRSSLYEDHGAIERHVRDTINFMKKVKYN